MLNLPPILVTPAAWKGAEIKLKPELWIWELESDDINELTTATQQFLQSGEPLENISKTNFHLPRAGALGINMKKPCGTWLLARA